MAQTTLKEVLGRIVRELDDEETREEFEALKNKKLTWAELKEAIAEAPPEERAALRQILLDEGVPPTGDGGPGDDDGAGAGNDDEPKPKPKRKPKPKDEPTRRTRPGRKSGAAYDWFVDEETGEVVRSPVAVIYSGADEPDEVEMLPVPATDDDDDQAGGDDLEGGDGE